jgi:hypothetical protein
MFSARDAKNDSNDDVFNVCKNLFQFFNTVDNLEDILDTQLYFAYPFVNPKQYALSDFIDYVLNLYPLILQKEAKFEIFNRSSAFLDDTLQQFILEKPKTLEDLMMLTNLPKLSQQELQEYVNDSYSRLKKKIIKTSEKITDFKLPSIDRVLKEYIKYDIYNMLDLYLNIKKHMTIIRFSLRSLQIFQQTLAIGNNILISEIDRFQQRINVLDKNFDDIYLLIEQMYFTLEKFNNQHYSEVRAELMSKIAKIIN